MAHNFTTVNKISLHVSFHNSFFFFFTLKFDNFFFFWDVLETWRLRLETCDLHMTPLVFGYFSWYLQGTECRYPALMKGNHVGWLVSWLLHIHVHLFRFKLPIFTVMVPKKDDCNPWSLHSKQDEMFLRSNLEHIRSKLMFLLIFVTDIPGHKRLINVFWLSFDIFCWHQHWTRISICRTTSEI